MYEQAEYIVTADALLTGKGFVPGMALRIKGGRIDAIDSVSSFDAGMQVLNFTGCTVTPCFCDYHLHFFSRNRGREMEMAEALLSKGITKVFDGGARDLFSFDMKDAVRNKLDVKAAGYAIYKKGSYGSYIGKSAGTVHEAEMMIEQLIHDGADYIKAVNSGVYVPDAGKISEGGFSFQELDLVVRYAKERGLTTACHANGERAIQDAAAAGVSMIIHGLGVSDDTLSWMAEKDIALIPTVNAFSSLKKISASKKAAADIERAVARHLLMVRRAFGKGVRVLPGSDAGPAFIPYGASYYEELLFFQQAGVPVEKVLLSAVRGPFKKGARADFLVMDGLMVQQVFMNGRCIKGRAQK